MKNINPDKADIRFPPPFMFLGFMLLGLALDKVASLPPIAFGPTLQWFGGAFIAGGVALIILSMGLFRASGENAEPWTSTGTIIARGPYRHSRNPMYLAMLVIQTGIAFWVGSAGILFFVPFALIAADRLFIAREEAYLTRKFGDTYTQYCRRVRRWI